MLVAVVELRTWDIRVRELACFERVWGPHRELLRNPYHPFGTSVLVAGTKVEHKLH
jgi:hypothetical protein